MQKSIQKDAKIPPKRFLWVPLGSLKVLSNPLGRKHAWPLRPFWPAFCVSGPSLSPGSWHSVLCFGAGSLVDESSQKSTSMLPCIFWSRKAIHQQEQDVQQQSLLCRHPCDSLFWIISSFIAPAAWLSKLLEIDLLLLCHDGNLD